MERLYTCPERGGREGAVRLSVIGAAAFAVSLAAAPAPAKAVVCMEHKTLVSYLSEKFGEHPHALGLVASSGVMEVYVSPKKGTWTIVMTSAQGVGCIIAAGDTWEDVRLAMADAPEF